MKKGSRKPLADKLRKYRVDANHCWIWFGSKGKDGYGVIGDPETKFGTKAHRKSWEHHRGPIPEGKDVLHNCDVRLCINPDHLYLGSDLDNARDKVERNRVQRVYLRGFANGMYGKTGAANPFFGKKHSEQTKARISETKKAFYASMSAEERAARARRSRVYVCKETAR